MFRRIVVPLDGSEFSRAALPYARALASGTDTTVDLVSAVDPLATLGGVGPGGLGAGGSVLAGGELGMGPAEVPGAATEILQAARGGREKGLRATAAATEAAGPARVEWRLLEGEASEAVAEHVAGSGADLVVMSTHGRGAIERAWLGSVADRLVRRLHVPVLLVRPTSDRREESDARDAPAGDAAAGGAPAEAAAGPAPVIRHILVPLDGSELGEAAIEPAVRVAEVAGASLILAQVTGPHVVVGSPYIPHAAHEHREHHETRAREAREYLEEVAERLRERGAEVTGVEVREGAAAASLLELAHSSADMIAMATHGHGGFRRWLLGSVSDKVLRGADRPVLLARPEERGEG